LWQYFTGNMYKLIMSKYDINCSVKLGLRFTALVIETKGNKYV